MKRKEFFNLGLYLEGLRRIRLPSVIFTVILTLEAVGVPLASFVADCISRKMALEQNYEYKSVAQSVTGMEVHPLLMAVLLVGTPILTYTLFSFLNKRNSSDFYHSLPHTRLALYVSTVAALLTSIASMILVTSGISRLSVALIPHIFTVEAGTYLSYMIGCFAMSALIAACMTIGVSITGTLLSNTVVTLLVMFLPRVVLKFITYAVADRFPLVPEAYVSPLLSSDINILSGLAFSAIDYGDITVILNASSQVYTLILAAAYLILGAVLFHRRRSESAEHSAPSRFMQHVYRITVAMTICTPICYAVFAGHLDLSYDWFALVVLYVIVVLVYFLYEIITTRKWKNLVRAVPGLAIVAALNLALLGVMLGITAAERTFTPDADDIDYVQIVTEHDYSDTWFFSFSEYATRESSGIKIDDPTVAKVVADSLKETIEYYDSHGTIHSHYDIMPSYAYPEGKLEGEKYETVTFKIKSGVGTKYRTLRVAQSDMNTVREVLASTEEYAKTWLTLPQAQRGTVYVYTDGVISVDSVRGDEIFDVMRREVAGLEFDEWYSFLTLQADVLGYVDYHTNGVDLSVPFNAELLPETTDAFFEAFNHDNKENTDATLKLLRENDDAYIEYVYLCSYENGAYNNYSIDITAFPEEETEALFLEAIEAGDISYGDTYAQFSVMRPIEYETLDGDEKDVITGEYEMGVFKIKEEYVEKLIEYAY